MKNLENNPFWEELKEKSQRFLAHQPQSSASWPVASCGIELNYSHQKINKEELRLLVALATSCDLKNKINQLFSGKPLNSTENRPALHTALRANDNKKLWINNQNILDHVAFSKSEINRISTTIRNKLWLGYSGKPITDIVNIGIGGSDLGPRLCVQALQKYTSKAFGYHFVSDADPQRFDNTVEHLNPETTLFIVSSKSFTTRETLYNAHKAKQWIGDHPNQNAHFIAVTAQPQKAINLNFKTIVPIWDWVGGRYSFCSAINLISAIAIGYERFEDILLGARDMDHHFSNTPFESNLPVLLALIGVWNNNFLSIHNLLVLTYAQQLEQLVPYLQQLEMESNGKSIDKQGNLINYATAPIVWGGPGNQAQHSYYQLLCQGTHKVSADLVMLKSTENEIITEAAKAKATILNQGTSSKGKKNTNVLGGMPINQLWLDDCSAYTLGALIAMYEHKVFTQSVIWNINPFDQPGVESAKSAAFYSNESITAC